jgi:hypothetical protein
MLDDIEYISRASFSDGIRSAARILRRKRAYSSSEMSRYLDRHASRLEKLLEHDDDPRQKGNK